MAMVCPQCDERFEQRLQCPQCGVRLLYQASSGNGRGGLFPEESWQQTPWGRLVIGLLLAQGLFYVLQHLFTAGLLVARDEAAASVWATLTGLIIHQSLQAVSILASSLLTGAGQRRGFLFGALVGVWNGVFFILAQHWLEQPLTVVNLFGEPILQTAFGALGGLAGSLIWKPPAALPLHLEAPAARPLVPVRRSRSAFAGPVAWTRVVTGITVAVGGVLWASVIREFVLEASEGKLRIDTHLQAQLVTWEISGLAILAGSALAGATVSNSSKQGLLVGIGTATVLLGVRLASAANELRMLALLVSSALCLGLAGGWFGGQLLPPLYAPPRHRRMDPASV